MLFAKPTPKGTGAEFWGDCNDLKSLYDTMKKLSQPSSVSDGSYARNEQLLSIVSYEVRHAFQADRLVDNTIDNGADVATTYYGFCSDWITLLYTISALRHNAGRMPTDELDQSNLIQLEYWTREALHMYDCIGAKTIEQFIGNRIDVSTKYVYLIQQDLVRRYFSLKPGKTRFRTIPHLLMSMGYGKELDSFIKHIEDEANELGCNIEDMECDEMAPIIW